MVVRVTSRVHNQVTSGFHVLYLETPENPMQESTPKLQLEGKDYLGYEIYFSH